MSPAYKIDRLPEKGAYSTTPKKGLIKVELERPAEPGERAFIDRDGTSKFVQTVYIEPSRYNTVRRADSAVYEPIASRTKSLVSRQLSILGKRGKEKMKNVPAISGRLIAAGYGFLLNAPENVETALRKTRLGVRKSTRATGEYLDAHKTVRNVGMAVTGILLAYGGYSVVSTNIAQNHFLAHVRAEAAKMSAEGASGRQKIKESLEEEVRRTDYLSDDDRERAYKRINYEFNRSSSNSSLAAR